MHKYMILAYDFSIWISYLFMMIVIVIDVMYQIITIYRHHSHINILM